MRRHRTVCVCPLLDLNTLALYKLFQALRNVVTECHLLLFGKQKRSRKTFAFVAKLTLGKCETVTLEGY